MKKLVVSFAAVALALGTAFALTTVKAPAAHADTCFTGRFDLQNVFDSPLFLLTLGHNNPITQTSNDSSDFCLVNEGGGWYEFMDTAAQECLNVSSAQEVYMDACIGSTPEQFTQPFGHYWYNRHFGTARGYLTAACNFDSNVVTEGIDNGCPTVDNQEWATPTS